MSGPGETPRQPKRRIAPAKAAGKARSYTERTPKRKGEIPVGPPANHVTSGAAPRSPSQPTRRGTGKKR